MRPHELLSPDTQATLLLLGRFVGEEDDSRRPLTPTEYNRLAKHLLAVGLRPADLLSTDPARAPTVPGDLVAPERLDGLLRRGVAMALALDRWNQLGIGVLGRSDAAYPAKLRRQLKAAAPPLLFVAGPTELLGSDAICVVGARDATASGLRFARSTGAACAAEGLAVVSGNARGVDQEAMWGALDAGGRAIGILAESLGKAVLTKRNRQALMNGTLALASPFSPEAPFTVAHAMDRNKYLYGMSLSAIVVDSDVRGGTWSGAVENHKHGWVPAFVRVGDEVLEGNPQLARLGLTPVNEEALELKGWLRELITRSAPVRPALAHEKLDASNLYLSFHGDLDPAFAEQRAAGDVSSSATTKAKGDDRPTDEAERSPADDLFAVFIARLASFLEKAPRSEQQVAEYFSIEFSQARKWLEKAYEQHLLRKVAVRPVERAADSREGPVGVAPALQIAQEGPSVDRFVALPNAK